MKRTPLKRSTKPIRRVSKKRAVVNRSYSAKRVAFLTARPICEVCKTRATSDVHHKAGRLGGNLLNEETWLSVCRGCHTEIHERPSWARAMGYLTR